MESAHLQGREGGLTMGILVREKPKGSGRWWVLINHKDRRASKAIKKRLEAVLRAKLVEAERAFRMEV